MRSILANLRTLTLPAGVTTGARIVLDGVNGTITVFDANNEVRFRTGVPGGTIDLGTGDPDEFLLGDIQASVAGAGNTRRLDLTIETPKFNGGERAIIDMFSTNFNGTVGPAIEIQADFLDLIAATAGVSPLLSVAGHGIGYGITVNGFPTPKVANDANRAAGVLTDMAVTVALEAGRIYAVHAHSQYLAAAAGAYAIELDHDGTVVGRFDRKDTAAGEVALFSSTFMYAPAADDGAATLTVKNGAGSAGNLQLQATAANPRNITVQDAGV